MSPESGHRWRNLSAAFGLFAWVLLGHGALPFAAMPTLGQALWTTGFSTSFARGGLFNLYAHNFGLPAPAPIAFGLPGAYPAGLFIAAGLHPGDAYAAVLWLWLAIAFWGARRVGYHLGLSSPMASLAAAVWLTLPLVWNHAHYSMLSMGFALLPTYFLAPLVLVRRPPLTLRDRLRHAVAYAVTATLAMFMDGYTFVFFAVAASLLLIWTLATEITLRRAILLFGLPLHALSLAVAGKLYTSYVGRTGFAVEPLDAFRGWGLDLRFLAIPTTGTHWLFDVIGLSESRSTVEQFGDASVWQTTFLLPLVLLGLFAFWRTRNRLALVFLVTALFGGYMALGPSVKLHHTRPLAMQSQPNPLMPAELAGPRTGNGFLSKHLPGFKNMRASYRWMGLSALGFWLLVLLWLAQPGERRRYVVLLLILLANTPQLQVKWQTDIDYRNNLRTLDTALLDDLRSQLKQQERVLFLPFGNDFIVNYLASRLDVRAYNIGGDKNLAMARAQWPTTLQQFEMGRIDPGFVPRIQKVLEQERDVDVVILPYFDMLWAAHHWPCGEQHLAKCPDEIAADLAPTLRALQATPGLQILPRERYILVRRGN